MIESEALRLYSRGHGEDWNILGPVLNATVLSDDYRVGWDRFAGTFVGVCCLDPSGQNHHADFGRFDYVEL